MSLDPLANVQPDKTPYHFVSNSPLIRVDPTGMVDRKYKDYETGEDLGEIDDGVDQTVNITKNDFNQLQERYKKDLSLANTKLPSYNEMIERYSIGKKGYDIAQTALKYEGSLDWDYDVKKGNFGKGTYKCNKFVQDVLSENGAAPPGTWPPLAGAWANTDVKISGWSKVTQPNLGDVVAGGYPYTDASGHVVIITGIDLNTGRIQATGTVHSNFIGDNGYGNNLINNKGVHDGKTYTPVGIRRYTGKQ
jgi:hypothetical protein